MNFQQKTVLRQKLFDSCSLYLLKELCLMVLEYAKEFEGVLMDQWCESTVRGLFDVNNGVVRGHGFINDLKAKRILKASYFSWDFCYGKGGERCVNGDQYWYKRDNQLISGHFSNPKEQRIIVDHTILKLQYWNNELRYLMLKENKMFLVYPFQPLTPIKQLKLPETTVKTCEGPQFSPNGKYLFFRSQHVHFLYNLKTDALKSSILDFGRIYSDVECGMNNIFTIVNGNRLIVYDYDFKLVLQMVVPQIDLEVPFFRMFPVDDGLVGYISSVGFLYYL